VNHCWPLPVSDPACSKNKEEGVSMSMVSEFKEFAAKGNVMDLAVGVIIGGAFGKIVDSIVNDLIMPLVGKVTGGLDFSSYYIGLNGQAAGLPLAEARKAGAVFAYGNFITVLIYFIILAFIIFMMIKQVNKLKKEAPPAPPATPEDVLLLRQIRDSLKK
jgi:large conductance mechanosensitive channel